MNGPMKLISLVEPWATLMALIYKRVETRDWITYYRGPLAIHASKHGMSLQDTLAICKNPVFANALMTYPPFRDEMLRLQSLGIDWQNYKQSMKRAFPNRGKIVAVVNLQDICPTASIVERHPKLMTSTELAFGDYDAVDKDSGNARQGWITEMWFQVPEPIPFTSKQGLVEVPQDVRQELRRQWSLKNK